LYNGGGGDGQWSVLVVLVLGGDLRVIFFFVLPWLRDRPLPCGPFLGS